MKTSASRPPEDRGVAADVLAQPVDGDVEREGRVRVARRHPLGEGAEVGDPGQAEQPAGAVDGRVVVLRRQVGDAREVAAQGRVDVAGPGAHDQPLGRRQPHRGLDAPPAVDGARARTVAEVQHDEVEVLGVPPHEPGRAARHLRVRAAVEAVAAHVRAPRATSARDGVRVRLRRQGRWNPVSKTATCGVSGNASCARTIPSTLAGLCSGARSDRSRSAARPRRRRRATGSVNRPPPWTTRCPTATQVVRVERGARGRPGPRGPRRTPRRASGLSTGSSSAARRPRGGGAGSRRRSRTPARPRRCRPLAASTTRYFREEDPALTTRTCPSGRSRRGSARRPSPVARLHRRDRDGVDDVAHQWRRGTGRSPGGSGPGARARSRPRRRCAAPPCRCCCRC